MLYSQFVKKVIIVLSVRCEILPTQNDNDFNNHSFEK